MSFVGTATALVAVSAGLVFVIRKNLEQRALARKLREIFIQEANDLVAKAEFPEAHARLLINMASIPQGWMTRFLVAALAKELFFGKSARKRRDAPSLEQVPPNLRKKFVLAILAFTLSDSYRCVIFGHVMRATNNWLGDAVREPKADVNAHATRNVIEQVAQIPSRQARHREPELLSA
jgi:hypothetical protein